MPDERKLPRKKTDAYIGIHDMDSNKLIGCLVDLTVKGIQFMSEVEYEPGQTVNIKLILPRVIDGTKEILVTGVNIWCHTSVDPRFYSAGFEFGELSEQTVTRLELLLESSLFKKRNLFKSGMAMREC